MEIEDLQIVDSYTQGAKSAVMRINRPISNDPSKGITGARFAAEMDFLLSVGVKKFLFPINSLGGSVFSGMEIFSAIEDVPDDVETETRVVGTAFSMAGVISQAGKKRTIKKGALFHAHAPRPAQGKKVGAELLNLSYNSIKTLLSARSGISEEEADKILSKESFFEAEAARDKGFFDEVIGDTKTAVSISADMSEIEIMNEFNKIENKKIIKKDMSKVNEILEISAEASETAQITAVTALKAEAAKATRLESEATQKDQEIATLKAEIEASKTSAATALIEAEIKAGKIDEAQKEIWVQNAKRDPEGTALMLGGLQVSTTAAGKNEANSITAQITAAGQKGGITESNKAWTFKEWSQNDPEGLQAMQINNKAKFDELLEAYEG